MTSNETKTQKGNEMNKITINGRTVYYSRFASLDLARSYADGCKGMGVMFGDHPCYWVATLADCQRLEKAGYEWA